MSARLLPAALAALLVAGAAAAADPLLHRPEPVDFDAAEEQRSNFWEWTLAPERELYDNRVARARRLMERRNQPDAETEAAALLEEAIRLDRTRPEAYWDLAEIYERQERWKECTDLRQRILSIDPAWDPPHDSRRDSYALDFGLGFCASRAGQHERAIERYKHILRTGEARSTYEIQWRLGESYMALGRLDEALLALGEAAKLYSGSPSIHFALAVAYDRDEQPARSREHLVQAVSRDPGLNKLTSSYVSYAPPEDRYYYEGLGYLGKGESEQALIRFRHYLHAAPDSPWTPRVRHHLETLAHDTRTSPRIDVAGAHGVDTAELTRAVGAVADDLDECLKPTPGLLLRAQITTLARNRSDDRTDNDPEPGVKATILYSFATDADAAIAAVACVERVAGQIRLPALSAKQGRYLQLSFPTLSR